MALNYAARAEEQKGFEEGVGHEVKNSGGESADAESEEHVAELADGGYIGENFLDVGFDEAMEAARLPLRLLRWPRRSWR